MKRTLPIGILLLIAVPSLAFSAPQMPHLTKLVPPIRSTTEPFTRTMRSQHLFLSSSAIMHQASQRQYADEDDSDQHPVAKLVRGVANALHAPTRFATGLVVTAIYISVVAFTSGCVRGSVAFLLARFPTWPFLILFFVPLYVVRSWASPKKRQERYALYREIMNDAEWDDSAADAPREADRFAESMEQQYSRRLLVPVRVV